VTRLGRIASTTAFKLSAIYLSVFTAFAIVFAVAITYAADRFLNQQVNDAIASEFLDLSQEWNSGGAFGLVDAIEERIRRPGASLYMLTDINGRLVVGNVTSISSDLLSRAVREPTAVDYETPQGEQRVAMVQVVRLTGEMFLLVGRDMTERQRFEDVVRYALVAAAVLLLGLGIVSWFFVSRRVLKRVDSVAVTTRRIMAGDLSGRLEVTGSNDEFDRLAESLNAMLERIELLLGGLAEVTDNVAHDLKTPLTRIRNRIEAVLAEPADAERQRDVMQATIEDADQLITTFNALLTIARLEAGSGDGATERVDAAAVARDVAELYEPLAEEAGVALSVDAEDPTPIRGNRELLGQAIANLVDNAIKHGRSDTTDADARVAMTVRSENNEAVIAVRDNGPGIPAAERGRVVQRFVRLEKSRTTPGTGLGLSLVAAFARLGQGSLTLDDADPGLVATLRFPLDSGDG